MDKAESFLTHQDKSLSEHSGETILALPVEELSSDSQNRVIKAIPVAVLKTLSSTVKKVNQMMTETKKNMSGHPYK